MKIPTPTTGDISLYFHIPFCRKKCPYCHFFVIRDDLEKQKALLCALVNEISQKEDLIRDKKIISIYFGGGTPFLFETSFLKKVVQKIYACKTKISNDIEITIEANPEDINIEKIKHLREMGFNRISIGVQSLDDRLLKLLGRSHGKDTILRALNTVYEGGIENISIDLMYDVPNQTISSWQNTLNQLEKLPISHISLYNLTIEPNTAFYRKKDELTKMRPTEDISKEMLMKAITSFEKLGLIRYEISAFARNDKYSRHNVGYWLNRTSIGYGPSAFSYYNDERMQNCCSFAKYINAILKKESPIDFVDLISFSEKIKEAFIISLRLIQGVNITSFENRYGKLPSDAKEAIEKLHIEGYLQKSKKNINLTDKGLLFYDSVASEII